MKLQTRLLGNVPDVTVPTSVSQTFLLDLIYAMAMLRRDGFTMIGWKH